jgi:hypothetical protein
MMQQGLNARQLERVDYECDLLRMTKEQLIYVAPWLFCNGITASNTVAYEDKEKEYDTDIPETNPKSEYYLGWDL